MKPITWFAPMWAFLCGAVASGATSWALPDLGRLLLGVIMAGPILCGLSQVINDYFDSPVDALNEPHRLIPSGLVTDNQVIITVAALLLLGVGISIGLGPAVAACVGLGLFLALLYSAPPARAKRNGWVGNALVAISYEGLAWLSGHLAFAPLTLSSLLLAALFSFGAHGIMSINDYKSIAGDIASNIRTIPVQLGPQRSAWVIILTMDLAQLAVISLLFFWGAWLAAAGVLALLLAQLPLQRHFVRRPLETYLKFSAIGVSYYVLGMMVAAFGLRGLQI